MMITTEQAAESLGVSTRRVLQFITTGRLRARKIGRDWLIDPRNLDKLRHRPGPGRPRKEQP